MRVFLVQTAHGLSAPSGGYRSNLGFLRQLRSYGHAVAQSCYAFDVEIDESATKAKAKGIDPEIQHLPGLDLGKDPQTGLERYVPVTKFIDEDGIHNLAISRTFWKFYQSEERSEDQKAYLEVTYIPPRPVDLSSGC
jgi:hypothetical protein